MLARQPTFLGSTKPENEDLWMEEKDCLLLLLRSRVLMRGILQKRLYEDRVSAGNLSAFEVVQLLESQGEGDDTDFVAQITERRRTLMSETRRMREQERTIEDTDKKISRLIKNAGQVSALQHKPPKRKDKGKDKDKDQSQLEKMPESTLVMYCNLFYILQTEPLYLARIIEVLEDRYSVKVISDMVETILLTLFGDAFSPREEHLLLGVFRYAIEAIFSRCNKLTDFVETKTIAPMVLTYAKRKQGIECVQSTVGNIITDLISASSKRGGGAVSFELNARKIHDAFISRQEIETGVKLTANRNFVEKRILEEPEVKAALETNKNALLASCDMFFKAIVDNVKKVPYGLRWICKQIEKNARETFPKASTEDIGRSIAHYIFFRFYSVAIVSPAAFKIYSGEIVPDAQLNLLAVSKVLYSLFNGTPFSSKSEKDKWYAPLNEWLEQNIPRCQKFFEELIDVEEPEDFLEVDAYLELIQAVKPTIIISYGEIHKTHEIVHDNIDEIGAALSGGKEKKKDKGKDKDKEAATSSSTVSITPAALAAKNDVLKNLLKELSEPKKYAYPDEKEIQLTLVPKSSNTDAGDGSAGKSEDAMLLFNTTKMLTVKTLRMIPSDKIKASADTTSFSDLLKVGLALAKETENAALKTNIASIKTNLEKLAKQGHANINKDDGYRSFMKAVALEIANRAQIAEQQRSELQRLTSHIDTVRGKIAEHEQLIETLNEYLRKCKENQFSFKGAGKKSKKVQSGTKTIGPFPFTYPELVKQRVIVSSDVPKMWYKAIKFVITSEVPGEFVIDVKVTGIPMKVDPLDIDLDELLDKQAQNIERISKVIMIKDEEAEVELDVNMTIHLFNKLLAKKK